MTHDEAVNIVVRAGRQGQMELLKALFDEMNVNDMEAELSEQGYVPVD